MSTVNEVCRYVTTYADKLYTVSNLEQLQATSSEQGMRLDQQTKT